jgi:hypothetical protein
VLGDPDAEDFEGGLVSGGGGRDVEGFGGGHGQAPVWVVAAVSTNSGPDEFSNDRGRFRQGVVGG